MLMRPTPVLRRWLLAGVCLLQLLGLATPLLAVGAAARQGVELQQICPLHGLPMAMAEGADPAAPEQSSPAGDGNGNGISNGHGISNGDGSAPLTPSTSLASACPLASLSLDAPLMQPALEPQVGLPPRTEPVARPVERSPRLDASLRWSLRRKHGPPVTATG
ncbi:MAG: hypothetical protein RL722_2076 [Pseudomonadota bacterium]|jgi:hypothetical protein